MTTEIGKELRKLRIDEDERLLDMAARLDRSSAFISAVERGTKTPPEGFVDLVIKAYKLAGDAAASLRRAADRSRKSFTLMDGIYTTSTARSREKLILYWKRMMKSFPWKSSLVRITNVIMRCPNS